MILHYRNNWKYTCSISINLGFGSFREPKECLGYTHIAEHLMFCGTKNINKEEFQEYCDTIFSHFKATTSKIGTIIYCTFSVSDFDKVIYILKEIIYNWECTKKDFDEEKKYLMEEINEYEESYDYMFRKETLKLLPIPQNTVMGSITKMKKLRFDELINIKNYWDEMIEKNEKTIVIIGGDIKKELLKKLEKTFKTKKDKNKVEIKRFQITEAQLKKDKNSASLYFKSNAKHLCSLLLYYIFDWSNYNDKNYHIATDFSHLKNVTAFHLYDEKKKLTNKIVNKIFFSSINKKNFEFGKEMLIKEIEEELDIVYIQDSQASFDGLLTYTYPTNLNSIKQIYQYLNNISYQDFKTFYKEIIDKLEKTI